MEEGLYFAYGSNMNLDQMGYRCPDAEVVGSVQLEDYRLAFCGRTSRSGVATILPEKGSYVNGVLWRITPVCEKNLDRYEGYPHLYGKEIVTVKDAGGSIQSVTVYTMNSPYKECPAVPSDFYLKGILEGCRQNDIPSNPIMGAVKRTMAEVKGKRQKQQKTKNHIAR